MPDGRIEIALRNVQYNSASQIVPKPKTEDANIFGEKPK